MSYSFGVRGATRALAIAAAVAKLDEVVASQPIHSTDRAQAQAAVEAFVNVIPDDESQDVYVSVSGSVGWRGTLDDAVVISASVNVSAYLVAKES